MTWRSSPCRQSPSPGCRSTGRGRGGAGSPGRSSTAGGGCLLPPPPPPAHLVVPVVEGHHLLGGEDHPVTARTALLPVLALDQVGGHRGLLQEPRLGAKVVTRYYKGLLHPATFLSASCSRPYRISWPPARHTHWGAGGQQGGRHLPGRVQGLGARPAPEAVPGQEVRKSGCQEIRRSGCQEVRCRTAGAPTCGNVHWPPPSSRQRRPCPGSEGRCLALPPP